MIRRPPRSTLSSSSAASDVYKRQDICVIFSPLDCPFGPTVQAKPHHAGLRSPSANMCTCFQKSDGKEDRQWFSGECRSAAETQHTNDECSLAPARESVIRFA